MEANRLREERDMQLTASEFWAKYSKLIEAFKSFWKNTYSQTIKNRKPLRRKAEGVDNVEHIGVEPMTS